MVIESKKINVKNSLMLKLQDLMTKDTLTYSNFTIKGSNKSYLTLDAAFLLGPEYVFFPRPFDLRP